MFSKFRKAREAEDLNLIPIMNLMMTLIPFLLLGAAFYQIGVIPTSLPTHTPAGSDEPEKTEIVTLNLQFEPALIELSASGAGLSEEELTALGATFEKKGDSFDLEAIRKKIEEIKEAYPKSDTMIVLPEETVQYQDLVDVLDVCREKFIPVEGKDPIRQALFPVTVFSKLLKPDPDDPIPGTEGTEGTDGDEGGQK